MQVLEKNREIIFEYLNRNRFMSKIEVVLHNSKDGQILKGRDQLLHSQSYFLAILLLVNSTIINAISCAISRRLQSREAFIEMIVCVFPGLE